MISLKKSLLFAVLLTVGCGSQTQTRVVPSSNPDAGTSMEKTGNGGFADEGAYQVLDAASTRAAKAISSFSNEKILKAYFKLKFGTVPPNFNQKSFADILAHVHLSPNERKFRDGRELMFDYSNDGNPPYIVALKPFLAAYSDWRSGTMPQGLVDSATKRLMHEAAHIFGLNEAQGIAFADGIASLLYYDVVRCEGTPYDVSLNLNASSNPQDTFSFMDGDVKTPEKLALFITGDPLKPAATKEGRDKDAAATSNWGVGLATKHTELTEPFDGYRLAGKAMQYGPARLVEDVEFSMTFNEDFLDGEGTLSSEAYKVKESHLFKCSHSGLKGALGKPAGDWGWGN
jgi:hypothetical protein